MKTKIEETKVDKRPKRWFRIMFLFVMLILVGLFLVFGINYYVKVSTKNQILAEQELDTLQDIDCILVLGAGVRGESPSPMLRDRLEKGI